MRTEWVGVGLAGAKQWLVPALASTMHFFNEFVY